MVRGDYIGLGLSLGFGLWWLQFPSSVISFYRWFHGDPISLPNATVIRVLGALWSALVLAVAASAFT